jgi:antitoxin component of MazEF toxin-antitoxin module
MKPKTVQAFKQGSSIVMVIPAPFADELEIGAGDFLHVSLKDKKLIAKKIPFDGLR